MNYRELQKALKDKGLKSHGTRADLEARLADAYYEPPKPTGKGFVYIGQGKENPSNIGLYGYMFKLNGEAVEVDEPFASNLRTNSHFKEV